MQNFFEISQLEQARERRGKPYHEFLRTAALSAGVYVLPAGGKDLQSPHGQDEMYYVVRGRAHMKVGAEERAVEAGGVIFVPAGVEHRFHTVVEELVLLVFFAPAES